jgi:hypothetical protein
MAVPGCRQLSTEEPEPRTGPQRSEDTRSGGRAEPGAWICEEPDSAVPRFDELAIRIRFCPSRICRLNVLDLVWAIRRRGVSSGGVRVAGSGAVRLRAGDHPRVQQTGAPDRSYR